MATKQVKRVGQSGRRKEGVMCGRRKKTVVRSAMMYGSEEKHFREV